MWPVFKWESVEREVISIAYHDYLVIPSVWR